MSPKPTPFRFCVPWTRLRGPRFCNWSLLALGLLLGSAVAGWGQTKEYVRLGGRVIAIESPAPPPPVLTVTPPPALTVVSGGSVPQSFSVTATNYTGSYTMTCAPAWCGFTPVSGVYSNSVANGQVSIVVPPGTPASAQQVTMTATGTGGVSGQQTFLVTVTAAGGGVGSPQSYVLATGTVLATSSMVVSLFNPRVEMRMHQIPLVSADSPIVASGDGQSGIYVWLVAGGSGLVYVVAQSPQDYAWCTTTQFAAGADLILRYQRGSGMPNLTFWLGSQPSLAQTANCFSFSGGSSNPTAISNTARVGQYPGSSGQVPANLALAWVRVFEGHDLSQTRPADTVTGSPAGERLRWEFDGTLFEAVGNRDMTVTSNAGSYMATPPFDPPITVSPVSAVLNSGMSQLFTGSAAGANPAVTWTPLPSGPTSSGGSFTYTAPHVTGTTYQTLRVASVANGAFRDVPITVQPIAINWSTVPPSAMSGGQSALVGASLSNLVAGASNLVTWTATGGSFSTATSASGLNVTWTAPTAGGTYTVTARSALDPLATVSASVVVSNVPPPPPMTLSFIEPPVGASIGPSAIRPVAVEASPAALQGVAWSINGGAAYTPAQFLAMPGYQIDFGALGKMSYFSEGAQNSWRNYYSPISVYGTQTLTFRGASVPTPSIYAQRTLTLTNIVPPPSYYTGGIVPASPSLNQFHTVSVRRDDPAGGNQALMDLWLTIDGSGSAQANASYFSCHIKFERAGTGWSLTVNDYGVGNSASQMVGQAGQVSMGVCTVDGATSSVTTQGNLVTFTANVKVDQNSWVNRWIYLLRPDGTWLDQYWMNF